MELSFIVLIICIVASKLILYDELKKLSKEDKLKLLENEHLRKTDGHY